MRWIFVIPKPRSGKSRDFDPSRWVCCRRPEKCDGNFRVYGQSYPCPLREKCAAGGKNSYEWSYGRRVQGRYPLLSEHYCHRTAWWHRRNGLMMAFRPDYLAEKRKIDRQRHGKEYDRRQQARRKAARERARAAEEPWARRELLPCGEDCENCPWGECRYGDAD